MRVAVFALLLATPVAASDYTVMTETGRLSERPSVFRQIDFPKSHFVEKPQLSDASSNAGASSFGLKDMSEETRVQTEQTLSELGAKRDGDRIVVDMPSDVLFDFDKSDIRPDARPVLARLVDVLGAMKGDRVTIIGHTDSKGSDAYNDRLSQQRAVSVKTWLVENGVASDMTTQGKGERMPVAPNETASGADDPAGRQKNRRVQFIIGGE